MAAIKSSVIATTERLGGVMVDVMLDSCSSVSLVQRNAHLQAQNIVRVKERKPLQLVTASGEQLPILINIRVPIKVGEQELLHEFVLVENLVALVILGVDFLHGNELMLDFTQGHNVEH